MQAGRHTSRHASQFACALAPRSRPCVPLPSSCVPLPSYKLAIERSHILRFLSHARAMLADTHAPIPL
eukprot:6212314-Pleurochrysis_carterae.AAC.3